MRTCGYCGGAMSRDVDRQVDPAGATVDHVIPRSEGGSDDPDNLQAAHRGCNQAKGVRIPWWTV